MKKFVLLFVFLFLILPTMAADCGKIEYKNIKDGIKLFYEDGFWVSKVDKKMKNYIVKKDVAHITGENEFYSPDDVYLFTTGTQYEFIKDGRLIGYSNTTFKFYEFFIQDGNLVSRELSKEEIQELFPEYKIITINDFSLKTNSLKIKKDRKVLKLILFNDTNMQLYNFDFYSDNSRFVKYPLKGFLEVKKSGMIQFSRSGDSSPDFPWFILLIRD